MQLDINNLKQQNIEQLVKSLEIVSSRLLECITKNSQTACSATPELQLLFNQWLELVSDRILEYAQSEGKIKPAELSSEIGVNTDSIMSLLVALQRQGKIRIDKIKLTVIDGSNHEICNCLK